MGISVGIKLQPQLSLMFSRKLYRYKAYRCGISFRNLLAAQALLEMMASPTTLELDGLTSFRCHPDTPFRFALILKSDKIKYWLEDRKSKKQW